MKALQLAPSTFSGLTPTPNMSVDNEEKYTKNAQKKDEIKKSQFSISNTDLIAKGLSSHNVNDTEVAYIKVGNLANFNTIRVGRISMEEIHRDVLYYDENNDEPIHVTNCYYFRPSPTGFLTFLFSSDASPQPFSVSVHSLGLPVPTFDNSFVSQISTAIPKFTDFGIDTRSAMISPSLPNFDFSLLKTILRGQLDRDDLPFASNHVETSTYGIFNGEVPVMLYGHRKFVETRTFHCSNWRFIDAEVNFYSCLNRAQMFVLMLITCYTPHNCFTKQFFVNWQLLEFGNLSLMMLYGKICNIFSNEIAKIGCSTTHSGALEFDPFANGFGRNRRLIMVKDIRSRTWVQVAAGMFLFMIQNAEAAIPVPKFAHESHAPMQDEGRSSFLMTILFFVLMVLSYLVVECPVGRRLCKMIDATTNRYFERKAKKSQVASAVLEAKKTLSEMFEAGEIHVESSPNKDPEGMTISVPIAEAVPIRSRATAAVKKTSREIISKVTYSKMFLMVLQMQLYYQNIFTHPKEIFACLIAVWFLSELFSENERSFFEPVTLLWWRFKYHSREMVKRAFRPFLRIVPSGYFAATMNGEFQAAKDSEEAESIAPTEFSSSTLESEVPINKIRIKTLEPVEPDTIDFVKSFGDGMLDNDLFDALIGEGHVYECVDLVRQIWFGPTVKDRGKIACAFYYCLALRRFVVQLTKNKRSKSVRAFSEILKSLQIVFGLESDEGKIPNWLENIQDSLAHISTIDKSSLHEGVTGFLSLLAITPIFFCELRDSNTYIDAYKSCVSFMRKGGISVQAVLGTLLKSSSAIFAASQTGNLSGVIKTLVIPDLKTAKFIELSEQVRRARSGTQPASYTSMVELMNRVRAVTKEYGDIVKSGRSKPIEETRYAECMKMSETMHLLVKSMGTKMEPAAVSLKGKPGIGKSVFMNYLINVNAVRESRENYLMVGKVNLADKYHTSLFSSTTDILFDDCNNLKPEFRQKTVEEAQLEATNTDCRAMNKPALPDKGNHFFLNVNTWNSENRYPIPTATMEVGSYIRRLGACYEMRIKPEFACPEGKVMKGIEIPEGGAHCQYRRWMYRNNGFDTWEEKYIGPWMEVREFLEDVFHHIDTHKEHERKMLDSRMQARDNSMCACNIMPARLCTCPLNRTVVLDELEAHTAMECSSVAVSCDSEDSDSSKWDLPYKGEIGEFDLGWFGNTSPTKPTFSQGIASWIYLSMMGDNFRARSLSYLWNNLIFEGVSVVFLALGLFLLYSSTNIAEIYVSVFISVLGMGILSFLKQLRAALSRVIGLSPLSALSMYGDFISQRASFWFDANKIKRALLIMAGTYVTKQAMKVAVEYFAHSKARDLKKIMKGAEPETLEPSEMFENVVEVIKKEEISNEPSWVQPVRVRPSGQHAAKTISVVDMQAKTLRNTFVMNYGSGNAVITMLNSSLGLTVAHAFIDSGTIVGRRLKIKDHKRNQEVVVDAILPHLSVINKKDVILIYMPNMPLGMLPDLRRFFPNSGGSGNTYVNQVTRSLSTSEPQCLMMEAQWVNQELIYEVNGMRLVAKNVIRTSASFGTIAGQCGSMYHFTASPRCFAGVHIAGNKVDTGVVAPVYADELLASENELKSRCGYLAPLEFAPHQPTVLGFEQKIDDKIDKRHSVNFIKDGRVDVTGSIAVRRMPVSALTVNPNLVPATECLGLKKTKVKPIMKHRRTFGKVIARSVVQAPQVDSKELMIATDQYADCICSLIPITKEKYPDLPLDRPLTMDETLNGIEKTPLGRTKMAGSGGSPGYKPKSYYYEEVDGRIYLKPEAELSILDQMARILSGQTSGSVSDGCLKDEPVSVTKMYLARMFTCVGLGEFLIASKYLKPMMEIWRTNPAKSETAIGLNRVGPEWYEASKGFFHPNFRNNCFDSDFKEYDLTQSPQLKSIDARVFARVARKCGWEEDHIKELERVMQLTMIPLVNVGGTIVALFNLFMSGILQTALGNGAHSSTVLRYDFNKYKKESGFKGEFCDHVKVLTLGDDLEAAVSDELREHGWHPKHLAETCAEFGLILTNADKTGPPGFKNAADVEFLKSKLHYHEATGMNVSVVGPKSYFKSYYLYLRSPALTYEEYSADLGRQVLLESYWGGEESYNEMRKRLISYHKKAGLPSFTEMEMDFSQRTEHELKKIGGFQDQPRLLGETNLGIKLIEEYDAIDDSDMTYASMITEEEFFDTPKEEIPSLLKEKREVIEASEHGFAAESEEIAPTGEDIRNITTLDQGVTDTVESGVKEQLLNSLPLDPRTKADNILYRRQQMESFSWTLDTIGGSADGVELRPWLAMSQKPIIQNRLGHVAGYRADIVVTFEISAPATVAGSLLACVQHYPDFSAVGDDILGGPSPSQQNCAWSQKQSQIMIAGNGDGIFKIKVPYLHPTNFIHVADTAAMQYMPVVRARVLTPLTSSLNVTPTVGVAIFMEFENLKTYGATSAGFSGPGIYEYFGDKFSAETEVNPVENFSGAATALSTGLEHISKIPGFGSLSMPATVVSKMGKIAHQFGFSKPLEVCPKENAPGTISGMANVRGVTPAKVLSPDPAQNVSIGGAHLGIETDEMALAWYTQRYSIISVSSVRTDDSPGTVVYSCNVTPSIFIGGGGDVVQPASCAVPPLFFNHWVGSMQYRVTMIAPTNVSGWLSISWDPLMSLHANKEEGVNLVDSTETLLINIAETRQLEFDVHWGSSHPALTTLGPLNRIDSQWADVALGRTDLHNGFLVFQVHQPIITSVGTPYELKMIVEARCHANIKFFDYTGCQHMEEFVTPGQPGDNLGAQPAQNLENFGVGLAATCVQMPVCTESDIPTPFLAPPRPQPTPGDTPSMVPLTSNPVAPPQSTPTGTTAPSTRSSWLPSFMSNSSGAPSDASQNSQQPSFSSRRPTSAPSWIPSGFPSRKISEEPTIISELPSARPSSGPSRAPSTNPSGEGETLAPTIFTCEDRNITSRAIPASMIRDYGDSYLEMNGVMGDYTFTKILTGTQFGSYTVSTYSVGSIGKREFELSGNSPVPIEINQGPVERDADGNFTIVSTQRGNCTGCEVIDDIYMEDDTGPDIKLFSGSRTNLPVDLAHVHTGRDNGYIFPLEATGPTLAAMRGHSGFLDLDLDEVIAEVFLQFPWIVEVPIHFVFQGDIEIFWMEDGQTHSSLYSSQFPQRFTNTFLLVHEHMSHFQVIAHGGLLSTYHVHYTGARRLNRIKAEAHEPQKGKWFKFGEEQSTEDIPPILAGENMKSFRSLLKIAIVMAEYRLSATPGAIATASVTNDLYSQEPRVRGTTLYSYMMRCYTGRRGGLCFYYHIKGHGSIEMSRYYDGAKAEFSWKGGTEVIDSRTNPTGCVKFPYYSMYLYDYAFWEPASVPSKHLCFSAWDGPLSVKESMFPAEDFSFFNFRGASMLRKPPG